MKSKTLTEGIIFYSSLIFFYFFQCTKDLSTVQYVFSKAITEFKFSGSTEILFFWGYRWSWWCFALLKIMHKYHRIILQHALENEAKNTQLALLQEQGSHTYLLPNPVKVQSYHTAFGTCHHMALHGTM